MLELQSFGAVCGQELYAGTRLNGLLQQQGQVVVVHTVEQVQQPRKRRSRAPVYLGFYKIEQGVQRLEVPEFVGLRERPGQQPGLGKKPFQKLRQGEIMYRGNPVVEIL